MLQVGRHSATYMAHVSLLVSCTTSCRASLIRGRRGCFSAAAFHELACGGAQRGTVSSPGATKHAHSFVDDSGMLARCIFLFSMERDLARLQELLWTLEEGGGWIWTGALSQRCLQSIRRCCKPLRRLRPSHSDITVYKTPAIQPLNVCLLGIFRRRAWC